MKLPSAEAVKLKRSERKYQMISLKVLCGFGMLLMCNAKTFWAPQRHPSSLWQPDEYCFLRYEMLKRNSVLLWNVRTEGV